MDHQKALSDLVAQQKTLLAEAKLKRDTFYLLKGKAFEPLLSALHEVFASVDPTVALFFDHKYSGEIRFTTSEATYEVEPNFSGFDPNWKLESGFKVTTTASYNSHLMTVINGRQVSYALDTEDDVIGDLLKLLSKIIARGH